MSKIKNSNEYDKKFNLSNKSGKDLIKCKKCYEYIYPIGTKVTLCFWCNYANTSEEE